MTDLEVTSGITEATSGGEYASFGRPRRAIRLPEKYGECCCHDTRLPANYVSDNVRIGRINAKFADRQELYWFEESKDWLLSIPVGSLLPAVLDCLANEGAFKAVRSDCGKEFKKPLLRVSYKKGMTKETSAKAKVSKCQ